MERMDRRRIDGGSLEGVDTLFVRGLRARRGTTSVDVPTVRNSRRNHEVN